MEGERIGLMGGSFNPIHQAHVAVARAAMEEAKLSRVLFLPTGAPPHKQEGLAEAGRRMDMVRLALAQEDGFEPSDIEMNREGIVYTVDTLAMLKERMPGAEFYYIIGEDTLYDLLNWREPDRVFGMCRFLVCHRPGTWSNDTKKTIKSALITRGAWFAYLSMEARGLSSTQVRADLSEGVEPAGLHPAVMEYIRVMGLYGVKPSPAGAADHMAELMAAMSIKRMAHTLCVAYAARQLAAKHGVDPERAALAALYHDCAKGTDLKQLQQIARDNKLTKDHALLGSGALLHALVGAHLAREVYGIRDMRVLDAIACHTMGRPEMTTLDMIVYLADKIEPGRENYPDLETIRALAQTDLLRAVELSLTSTVEYVGGQGREMHPATLKTLKWVKDQVKIHANENKGEHR